jgi:hypothetical protein
VFVFSLPLFIAGPIATFNSWNHFVKAQVPRVRGGDGEGGTIVALHSSLSDVAVLKCALRKFVFYLLTMEIFSHYFYMGELMGDWEVARKERKGEERKGTAGQHSVASFCLFVYCRPNRNLKCVPVYHC